MNIERISRERLEAPPGTVYTETILEPGYNFMLEHYFYPLVETNKAWTVMLCETGIISKGVARTLLDAILGLEIEGPEAMGKFDPRYEYFYSHMERYLIDKAGEEVAGEINIGRTRPEPLARMVTRERLLGVLDQLLVFCTTLVDIAEREAETVMPQWTHFQHAQLSTIGHYFLGIADALGRDFERLSAAYSTVNKSTLGCGALAGSSYPLDRQLVADLLGFDGFRENTIDCVSSSDFMLETSAALANMMVTLSRLCQDLYTWHTEEFDFVVVSDEYAGSSSMMPQKKNPYPFEYVRARAAHATGDMASVFGTLHNTNFQDIKDVEEETVYPVIRLFDETTRSLRLLGGTIFSMEFKRDNMLRRAAGGFASCTELAAKIHRQTDLSYRTTHRIVGNLVLRAYKQGKHATDVDAALVNEAAREVTGHDLSIDDTTVRAALDPRMFVEAHDVPGGPAPQAMTQAIKKARTRLEEHAQRVRQLRENLRRASNELTARVQQLTR
ncbi:MAG: argininosuccinate lyase [Actinomycetota bacterium]|nr:argininosuccinate lyase [Actinomycetota bacterium]